MACNSIIDFQKIINRQINEQERLAERITKIEALIAIFLNKDFEEYGTTIISNYLWVVYDLISEMKKINQDVLDDLTPLFKRV